MPATAAELVPTLSTKMVAGEPLVAGETVRLSESSAAVLNKYRKLYSADEAFGEAAREDARRRFVAAFALITARSTGGFEHRADAARKAVLGDKTTTTVNTNSRWRLPAVRVRPRRRAAQQLDGGRPRRESPCKSCAKALRCPWQ